MKRETTKKMNNIEIIEDELRVIKFRLKEEKNEEIKKNLLSFRRKLKCSIKEQQ